MEITCWLVAVVIAALYSTAAALSSAEIKYALPPRAHSLALYSRCAFFN
jgi:hypothetical protein